MTTESESPLEEVSLEEIRSVMLDAASDIDPDSSSARSFAAVRHLHYGLLRRGWVFESVESLIIWNWPRSRIDDDGFSVLTTDVWIDIEDADKGPESMRVNISLVGERDDGHGGWTLEFPLMAYDTLPLDQAEGFRVDDHLPDAWGGSASDDAPVPAWIAAQIAQLSPRDGANSWLHRRNANLAGGRPVDFLKKGHTAAVEYALRVEIEAGERANGVDN